MATRRILNPTQAQLRSWHRPRPHQRNTPEKFWAKVQKQRGCNGCWLWTGAVNNKHGYGKVIWDGREVRAHRKAWELTNSRRVPRRKLVLHRCDDRLCVRPDHLFVGTQRDNIHDMIQKGRSSNGIRVPNDEIAQIRAKLDAGMSIEQISRQTNRTQAIVYDVAHGRR